MYSDVFAQGYNWGSGSFQNPGYNQGPPQYQGQSLSYDPGPLQYPGYNEGPRRYPAYGQYPPYYAQPLPSYQNYDEYQDYPNDVRPHIVHEVIHITHNITSNSTGTGSFLADLMDLWKGITRSPYE